MPKPPELASVEAVIRRIGRILGWLLAGTVGFILVAYGVLIIVNLHDQPESPAVAAVRAIHPAETVADEENSYLLQLGFAVSPDDDPLRA